MAGLLFLGVIGIWLLVAIALALRIGSAVSERWRWLAKLVAFFLIALLPVADELAARPQFSSLCNEAVELSIDEVKIKGRTVRLKIAVLNAPVEGVIVPMTSSRMVFQDAATEEELGRYRTYTIRGGFMARLTGWPEGGRPWTFDTAGCGPEIDWTTLPGRFEFTLLK